MCVGIPMQVLRCEETRALCRDGQGAESWIDLLLTGPQAEGTWLMTFMGAARGVLEADEAARSIAALDALQTLMQGGEADLDAAFADLIERGPQLPDFLKDKQ